MTVLFSVPAHESTPIVKDTVDNIVKFVPDSHVVIHAARQFEDFDPAVFDGYDNVTINPVRFHTVLHESQLHLHLTNLVAAYNLGLNFDYFSIFHTNQMFVKPGFDQYIKQYQYSAWTDFDTFASVASRSDLHMHKSRMDYMFGFGSYPKVSALLAEGSFYSRDMIYYILDKCRSSKSFNEMNVPTNLEETVLVTLALHASGERGYGRPTTLWLGDTPVTQNIIDDVIQNKPVTQEYEDHLNKTKTISSDCLYSIKRIPRDINNPLRQYINGLVK